jgi:peptidoglycan/LPS O-acetylase OafA/YrhL
VWRGVRWTVVTPLVLATALAAQVVLGRLGAPAAGVATTLAELIGCFFAGAALYALRDRIPFSPVVATGAAAALAAAALIGGLRLVFPLAGTYLLLFLGCSRALPLQGFGRHGDFSYGLYVFAYPIQQAIVQHDGPGISIPAFFALAFVPTLVLAILSWHFVEAPALARKPRRAPVRVTAAPCPTPAAWPVTSPGGS